MGELCNWIFIWICSFQFVVGSRSYFTGTALSFISTTNTTQIFTITQKKWNMTQRTLKNKQFNIHKTGVKINEKHNVRVAFVENTVWPVRWK